MRRARSWVRCLTLSLGAAGVAACSVPSRSDLEVMQTVNDLAEAVNAMRQDYAVIADQVDSLRLIVARQDSVLRQLANLAGVAVPSTR